MNKLILPCLALWFYASCKTGPATGSTVEGILDVVLEQKDNQHVQFPDLYDSLAVKIAEDDKESLVLKGLLLNRGFTVVASGRGNHPLGPRIISVTLKKEACFCEVTKLYATTVEEDLYLLVESIRCADSLRFYSFDDAESNKQNR